MYKHCKYVISGFVDRALMNSIVTIRFRIYIVLMSSHLFFALFFSNVLMSFFRRDLNTYCDVMSCLSYGAIVDFMFRFSCIYYFHFFVAFLTLFICIILSTREAIKAITNCACLAEKKHKLTTRCTQRTNDNKTNSISTIIKLNVPL